MNAATEVIFTLLRLKLKLGKLYSMTQVEINYLQISKSTFKNTQTHAMAGL